MKKQTAEKQAAAENQAFERTSLEKQTAEKQAAAEKCRSAHNEKDI